MRFIKNSFKDHSLMGVGAVLWFIYLLVFNGILPKFYEDVDDMPVIMLITSVALLLVGAIFISIGGFYYITNKAGARGFKQRIHAFSKDFMNEIKNPLFLIILSVAIIIFLIALLMA